MKKEIDQLDTATAEEIYKWGVPAFLKITYATDVQKKSIVREYLRSQRQTPNEALQLIGKQNASMPASKCF